MAPRLAEMGLSPESEPPAEFCCEDLSPRFTGDEVQPLVSVALDVSGACNLACRYCAESATQPSRPPMTPEVMEAALRLLDKGLPPGIRPSVRLGSGEPLLALPLLKRLHAIVSEAPEPTDVFLTTNGTQIDENIADWLASTGWWIKISLDGPQAVHDAWRRGPQGQPTYARVSEAIRLVVERCPERTSVAAVLCRGTDPAHVFQAIAALGVRRVELVPVATRPAEGRDRIRPSVEDVGAYVRFINDYARAIAADGREAHPNLVRFEHAVQHAMGYGNPVVPCGAGRSYLSVGPDGAFYPCFRFVGLQDYVIGGLERGLNEDAVATFRSKAGRPTHRRRPCSICWAAPLCGGPCFSIAEFLGAERGKPDAVYCAYRLADARAAFWLVRHLRDKDVNTLLPYLPIEIESL